MAIDGARVEALYRELGPLIYRRCLKLLRNAADAADATQEVFVRVCANPQSFTHGPTELPWVYQIATRVCLNRLRGFARAKAATARATTGLSPMDLAHALADRALAAHVLSALDERVALVAVYHLVDGMTQEEVGEALSLSRKTVGKYLQRFFEEARALLAATA